MRRSNNRAVKRISSIRLPARWTIILNHWRQRLRLPWRPGSPHGANKKPTHSQRMASLYFRCMRTKKLYSSSCWFSRWRGLYCLSSGGNGSGKSTCSIIWAASSSTAITFQPWTCSRRSTRSRGASLSKTTYVLVVAAALFIIRIRTYIMDEGIISMSLNMLCPSMELSGDQ